MWMWCFGDGGNSVEIEAVISWHVVQPYRAAFGVADVRNALVERARKSCSLSQAMPSGLSNDRNVNRNDVEASRWGEVVADCYYGSRGACCRDSGDREFPRLSTHTCYTQLEQV